VARPFAATKTPPNSPHNLKGSWKCVGAESGTPFNEFEFEDGEWVDYDEKVRTKNHGNFALS
jgi:hypothetical protein